MTHEGSIEHVKEGIYTKGRRAICACGWRCPEVRAHHIEALKDQFAHVTDDTTPETPVHTPPTPETDDTEEVDW